VVFTIGLVRLEQAKVLYMYAKVCKGGPPRVLYLCCSAATVAKPSELELNMHNQQSSRRYNYYLLKASKDHR
jgi:hypothetical protein